MQRCNARSAVPRLLLGGLPTTRFRTTTVQLTLSSQFSSSASSRSGTRHLFVRLSSPTTAFPSLASRWSPIAGRRHISNAAASVAGSVTPELGRLTPAAAAELRHQLEARAEAGDADSQFKLGVLYCFGSEGSTTGGCSNHKQTPPQEEDSPVIDKDSLDFLIGPGYVVPKTDGENTRITNWKQWLKAERQKLKSAGESKATNQAEEASMGPNYALAAKWFHQSARQGHPLAQHFFAVQLMRGMGVEQNVEEAIRWLTVAATNGNSLSHYELGQLYYEGSLVPKDDAKANGYFVQAADLDNPNAQFWMGYCYHQGVNVEASVTKGLEYLEKAAGHKHPGALYYLGMMYRSGEGVPKDSEKMLAYLTSSAAEGEAEASFCLGDIYYNGSDAIEVDYPKALQHYREAARKGHANAMCCEGVMYFHGLGTEQSDEKAFYAYQAAALQNHPHACRNLAYMYHHGRGCAKSEANAEYFLKLADQCESQREQPTA